MTARDVDAHDRLGDGGVRVCAMGVLSAAEREHFLKRGFVIIRQAVPKTVIDKFARASWERTGYDPADPATWTKKFLRLEPTMRAPMKTDAPLAYGAICELVGGEERLEVDPRPPSLPPSLPPSRPGLPPSVCVFARARACV